MWCAFFACRRLVRMAVFCFMLAGTVTALQATLCADGMCKAVLATGCQVDEPDWFWDDNEKCSEGCPGYPYPDSQFCGNSTQGCGGNELKWKAHCDCYDTPRADAP